MSRRTLITSGVSVAALASVGYALWPRLDGYEEEMLRQRALLTENPPLLEFVRLATLAASGHNTQPWKFKVDAGRVGILPDMTRRTEVVDPDDHHLYVSLGCAAENLIIAAKAQGRSVEMGIDSGQETRIEMALSPGVPGDAELYTAIPLRQSTRSLYDGMPVSAEEIAILQAAARQEGVSVLIFTERADLDAVADFVIAGNSMQMDDPAFVAELRDWLRFTPRQAIETGDGLFSASSGNPVVPAWIAEPLFGQIFRKDSENAKYRAQIQSSSGVAVFVGDKADPEHWIKVGRSFQRFALQATALGIRNAHINQPIEVPDIRPEFAGWLGMPERRPDLVVRFGRAPALPMSPRRPVSEVVL
ncbi:MAG: Tat pathway signal protein [Rhodobacteraceae bacterium]|nr:Tat pathway signal protein [Paracoccaceae bacterium]